MFEKYKKVYKADYEKWYKVYFNNNTHTIALSDNNLTLWYEDELNEGQHKFKLKE